MATRIEFPLHDSFSLPGFRWVYSVLFFVAYTALAQVSMLLASEPANVTPLYPPAGLAWAGVLVFGMRALPIVFVSACVANGLPLFGHQGAVLAALVGSVIGAGEVLSVWLGCWLLLRFRGSGGYLLSVRDVVIFSLLSIFWVVSPSIGVTTLWLFGYLEPADYWHVWRTWWLGDSIGILLLTPLLLVLTNVATGPHKPSFDRQGLLALPLTAVVTIAVCVSELPLWYFLTAFTFYYATRLSHLGIVSVNVVVASVCVWANFFGVSSNGHLPPGVSLILLQMFIAFNTVIGLAFWCSQRNNQELSRKWSLAESKARLDTLTGIYNRRGFEECASQLLVGSKTAVVTLLILDIDHFKEINDRYGHDVGDQVLAGFAEILRATIRDNDVLARIGGEEFAIIVDQNEKAALQLAERIRVNIQDTPIVADAQKILVTASIGVQALLEGMSIHDWLKLADRHLYFAKQSGRNRVRGSAIDAVTPLAAYRSS